MKNPKLHPKRPETRIDVRNQGWKPDTFRRKLWIRQSHLWRFFCLAEHGHAYLASIRGRKTPWSLQNAREQLDREHVRSIAARDSSWRGEK